MWGVRQGGLKGGEGEGGSVGECGEGWEVRGVRGGEGCLVRLDVPSSTLRPPPPPRPALAYLPERVAAPRINDHA